MNRPCEIRIKIGEGTIQNAVEAWGLHLMDSDDTIIAPIKDYEVQEFPENDAPEVYPFTTLKSFDYKCTLLCIGNLDEVNATVSAFYDSLFTITPNKDLRQAKEVTLYNDYKGVRVTGYARTIEAKDYYLQLTEYEKGAFLFDFTLYVANPKTLVAL